MNKTALITGSSAGIGEAIARRLVKEGYKVFLTGRNEQRLKKIATDINAKGYWVGDLSEPDGANKLFCEAQKTLGNIDILVNNAGEYVWSSVETTTKDKIAHLFHLNLQVPYELCTLVVPEMKSNKYGRIVNIGSISGVVGEANASLYSASKSGLIGMSKAMALELAEYNITVNVVNPGWVKTELADKCFDGCDMDEAECIDMIPQRRFIHPNEVAGMVNYLLSDDAKGTTGQSINLCAGLSVG